MKAVYDLDDENFWHDVGIRLLPFGVFCNKLYRFMILAFLEDLATFRIIFLDLPNLCLLEGYR